eukprot:598068-Rhodomonas_salina.1
MARGTGTVEGSLKWGGGVQQERCTGAHRHTHAYSRAVPHTHTHTHTHTRDMTAALERFTHSVAAPTDPTETVTLSQTSPRDLA